MNPPIDDSAGYEILGELGRGSTGIVYQARHRKLGKLFAFKTLGYSPDFERIERRERFFREAQALTALTGPSETNIPELSVVGQVEGQPYHLREFIDGDTFARLVKVDLMNLREGIKILAVIAHAVQRIHDRGLIHRNLHPSNVLITLDRVPKLIGFGLVGTANPTDAGVHEIFGVRLIDDLTALQRMARWICTRLDSDNRRAEEFIRDCEATESVTDLASVLKRIP